MFVEQFDKGNIELNSIVLDHIQKYYSGVRYSSQAGYKPMHLRLQMAVDLIPKLTGCISHCQIIYYVADNQTMVEGKLSLRLRSTNLDWSLWQKQPIWSTAFKGQGDIKKIKQHSIYEYNLHTKTPI